MKILTPIESWFDRWLTAPEPNAAGRIGLYRIAYAIFYLWVVSHMTFQDIAYIPRAEWHPINLLSSLADIPSPLFFAIVEIVLIAALLLLLIGFKVRFATLMVLLTSLALQSFRVSFGKVAHGGLFIFFYLPLFLIFSDWGATYSLDAILRRRHTGKSVDAKNTSWRYIWPMRAVLIILAILFFSAAYIKMFRGGWLTDSNFIGKLLLERYFEMPFASGLPPNPIELFIGRSYILSLGLQATVLIFEGTFFLALFHPRLRYFYVTLAIVFHIFNVFFLDVGFVILQIAYLIIIDWQALYERLWPKRISAAVEHGLERLPSAAMAIGAVTLAVVVALLWHSIGSLASPLSAIYLETFWYVFSPIALVWFGRATYMLIRHFLRWLARRNSSPPITTASQLEGSVK